jgi:nanoRNase/pAp phosphatase (c-di-AMP/oligoRNAs hydrolase)
MDQTLTKQKIRDLKSIIGENDRIAIVLQDDPDPDAMASAIALRVLLKRNKQTTPIFAFKPVTRPENRAMARALEIEVTPALDEDLTSYDKIAMVDVEPPYFADRLPRADVVIDHHPGYQSGIAPFEDIRVDYGATASIMTEYLMTADERISERLATALLYGIRSDTLSLSRRATEADIWAFTQLYPLANIRLLRHIDQPELPLSFARVLSRTMTRFAARDGLAVVHLGKVDRDDIIVQMAEFCLQFEGVKWVAVSGRLGHDLVVAVRNRGLGKVNAGDMAKRVFADIGSAGGHRDMAKALVPLRKWREREGTVKDSAIEQRLRELFTQALFGGEEIAEGPPLGLRNGSKPSAAASSPAPEAHRT